MARFGLVGAARRGDALATGRFRGFRARGPVRRPRRALVPAARPLPTAAFGLMMGVTGHAVGWPQPEGRLPADLRTPWRRCLREHGGTIRTGRLVASLAELPGPRLAPRPDDARPARWPDRRPPLADAIAAGSERYRYGPGVFKIDWALDEPIPWRAEECARAGTVHLGGDAGGDRGVGGGAVARGDRGAALRAARPAEPLRPDACARRAAHGLGVLPRPERLERRHDGADRGASRALRARLPRADPRALDARPGGDGALQRELRGRRHQRRRRDPGAALHPSRRARLAVHDAAARASSSARPRRRRAAACTGCAASTPRRRRCVSGRATPTRADRTASERLFLGLARDRRPERLLPEEPREDERHERQSPSRRGRHR